MVGQGAQPVGEVFLFFRAMGWYPLTLSSAFDAIAAANANPGTLRVEDAGGRVIWKAPTIH